MTNQHTPILIIFPLFSFPQKKAEAYQIPASYFYSKFHLHKLDIQYLTNANESDDEFIYESLPKLLNDFPSHYIPLHKFLSPLHEDFTFIFPYLHLCELPPYDHHYIYDA